MCPFVYRISFCIFKNCAHSNWMLFLVSLDAAAAAVFLERRNISTFIDGKQITVKYTVSHKLCLSFNEMLLLLLVLCRSCCWFIFKEQNKPRYDANVGHFIFQTSTMNRRPMYFYFFGLASVWIGLCVL